MRWTYVYKDGSFWNGRTKAEQLEILKEFYPIGMKVVVIENERQDGIFDAPLPIDNEGIWIDGYEEKPGWYILRVKFILPYQRWEYQFREIHPGFFQPDVSELRNIKLREIGI